MRAKEFDVNISFKIKVDGDEYSVQTSTDQDSSQDDGHKMVPPLQQTIELQKASVGKHSEVISDLTQDDNTEQESNVAQTAVSPVMYPVGL